ncbi:hypothetical protein SGLAM104S_03008 [Streptomyces glaucescens]
MWKKGRTARTRSPGPASMAGSSWARLVAICRWVSMTPLGVPVVPEEYGRAARSSAGSMAMSGSGAADPSMSIRGRSAGALSQTKISRTPPASSAARRAVSSSGETVTIQRAAESPSCLANSSAVASGCTVVTAAPARVAA